MTLKVDYAAAQVYCMQGSFEGEFKALEFKKNYEEGEEKPLHPNLEEIIESWIDTHFISEYTESKIPSSIVGENEEVERESNGL
ncbi:hypothetical protein BAWEI_55980 [Bacillus mycoides]|uniref:Uncharacterized protein n=1 Tax=Bacillus mycoides TaxID=1405 RepID=A0AAP8KTL3_BACMY|nr:hypothetical protein BAWEI_55980 [Bacillus mycoides]PJN69562.1 hypothetical protein BACWE_35470 [Bacillus mycoides]